MESIEHSVDAFGISPRKTAVIFDCCLAHVYNLIARGELKAYRDGRSRKITMVSIRARQDRLLKASQQKNASKDAPADTGAEHVTA